MGRLTEANYLSRKVKLREHIEAARVAHRDAAFRHEIGEGDEASVIAAKASISALEDRVVGLDAAWERAKQEAALERAAEEAGKRAAAVAAVEKHLKARTKAAGQLAKLAKDLGEAWQQFEAASTAVVDATRPFAAQIGRDGYSQLRELLQGDFHSLKPTLGAELAEAGLRMTQNDFPAPHIRANIGRAQNPMDFTESRNAMVKAVVAGLVEAE
jgi:hypothetical protein